MNWNEITSSSGYGCRFLKHLCIHLISMKRLIGIKLAQNVSILRLLSVISLIFLCLLKKKIIIQKLGLDERKYNHKISIEHTFPLFLYVTGVFALFYVNFPSKNELISIILSSANLALALYFLKNCLVFLFVASIFLLSCYYFSGVLIFTALQLYLFLFYSIFRYFSGSLLSFPPVFSFAVVLYHFICTIRILWGKRKIIQSTLRNTVLLVYKNLCLFSATLFLASLFCFVKAVVIFSIVYSRDASGNFVLVNDLHAYCAVFFFLFCYLIIANFVTFFIYSSVHSQTGGKKKSEYSSFWYAIKNFHHALTSAIYNISKLKTIKSCEVNLRKFKLRPFFFGCQALASVLKALGLFVLQSVLFVLYFLSKLICLFDDANAPKFDEASACPSSFLMDRSHKNLSGSSIILLFKLMLSSIFLSAVYFIDQNSFSVFYAFIFNRMLISYKFPLTFIDSSLILETLLGLFFTISIIMFVDCFRAIILAYQYDETSK